MKVVLTILSAVLASSVALADSRRPPGPSHPHHPFEETTRVRGGVSPYQKPVAPLTLHKQVDPKYRAPLQGPGPRALNPQPIPPGHAAHLPHPLGPEH
jgi:hypothetical protein